MPNSILLVEDSLNDTELILKAVEECNLAHEIAVVHDGEETMDYLHRTGKFSKRPQGHPVVIILDIKLNKQSGLEILRLIKNSDSFNLVPVVIFTSSGEKKDILESYKIGANAYVVKPLDFQSFMTVVNKLYAFWATVNETP